MIEAIFVEEEGARRSFVALDVLADADDVAAGAKTTPLGMVDQDDADVRIVAPLDQRVGHVPDHLAIQAMQRLGPVEAQASSEPLFLRQYVLAGHRHVHHGIMT